MEFPPGLLDDVSNQFSKNFEGYEFNPKIREMETNMKEAEKREKAATT